MPDPLQSVDGYYTSNLRSALLYLLAWRDFGDLENRETISSGGNSPVRDTFTLLDERADEVNSGPTPKSTSSSPHRPRPDQPLNNRRPAHLQANHRYLTYPRQTLTLSALLPPKPIRRR